MPALTLKAPIPNHLYSTRGGNARSDGDGLIVDVAAGSQMFTDLLASGCYVFPTPAAPSADDSPEPVA